MEITPHGLVRITALDGVVIKGYINGSKLKRFYGPLTLQTLQVIHLDQKKKKEDKLRQQKACQEAKERERHRKMKSIRMTLYKRTLIDENQGDDEPHVELTKILLNL